MVVLGVGKVTPFWPKGPEMKIAGGFGEISSFLKHRSVRRNPVCLRPTFVQLCGDVSAAVAML